MCVYIYTHTRDVYTTVVSGSSPSLARASSRFFAVSVWHSSPVHLGQCNGLSHVAKSVVCVGVCVYVCLCLCVRKRVHLG